jgi:hypothetical protein
MKKLLLTLFILLISCDVFAAGACVENTDYANNGSITKWRVYTCTGSADDGTIANTTITGFSGYYLYTIETWPGGTAPTDETDFTLLDALTGEDLMGGNGTNGIDATSKLTLIPKSAAMSLNLFHLVKGNLTFVVSNQAVHSAVFCVRITGVK